MDPIAGKIFATGLILLVVGTAAGALFGLGAMVFGIVGLRRFAKNPRPNRGGLLVLYVIALLVGVPAFFSCSYVLFLMATAALGQGTLAPAG